MNPINPHDWYWTIETWEDDISPANASTIISIANKAIDDFVEANPDATSEEMTIFCDNLWSEYCWCRWMPTEPQTLSFSKGDYSALLEKALSENARQIDIDTLGEYLAYWGEDRAKTEERYSLGSGRFLYPIYSRWPDRHGCYSLLRYEIRTEKA